jgi:P-type Cu2+ transporter
MIVESPELGARRQSSRETVHCEHCSLPVPSGLVRAQAEHQFCCHGCETAYGIIHSCGLDKYYAIRDGLGEAATPSRASGRSYREFEDPAFRRLYVRGQDGGACWTELFLQGVHCSACVWLVERLPKILDGVLEARLDMRRAMVRVTWRDDVVSLSKIAAALDALGYAPHPARDATARQRRIHEDRVALVRIAVAGACAANVMLFGTALYAGLFDEMEASHVAFFRWMSMACTVLSLLWPGRVFFKSAWGAIRTRTAHLDVPIALALAAGGIWSVIATVRGAGEVYFDSLSVLVFALLVGRFIQARQQRWASDSIELLFSLTPTSARRVENEDGVELIKDVPIEAVHPGDVLEVRAGESIPADGEVAYGSSSVDQALLTGESSPVAVRPGDAIAAGAVNISSVLRMTVVATGESTRVGKLMTMVEECARRRAPIVRLADRASGWFVIGMLGLAALTLGVWLWLDAKHAIDHAVALLIVTCPCALGLATPLALTVALGRAARRGILIKGGDAVQRLDSPGTIFLDKTGTITFGRLSLVRIDGDPTVAPLVAAIERTSSHPIALALVRDLGAKLEAHSDDDLAGSLPVENVESTTGAGVRGLVDGREVIVSSPAFAKASGARDPRGLWSRELAIADEGLTPVAVVVDGELAAMLAMGDQVRPDSADVIQSLRSLGWRIGILSGDHPRVAAAVARQVGVHPEAAQGGLSPERKLAIVREASLSGNVVMVGDGVNDAAALAAAGVGVAVHGGAEASLAAADVYLNRPGLRPVEELLVGSRRAMGVIRRNLGASLFYNITAAALAVTGLINPLLAAIFMPVSSLTVLALSFRSRSFDEPEGGSR